MPMKAEDNPTVDRSHVYMVCRTKTKDSYLRHHNGIGLKVVAELRNFNTAMYLAKRIRQETGCFTIVLRRRIAF